MRAFLSHSSANKDLVTQVFDRLGKKSAWIDHAEIEWGELFLEKISEGIERASDFVLFWSLEASKSEWVRLELNMAFIQALRWKAIRLRVILLDGTPLPLYLQPFHVFSVAGSFAKVADIVKKLEPILQEPVRATRARFVNRHKQFELFEGAVDSSETRIVWAFGFTGVGKSTLVRETILRLFEGANTIEIEISQSTGYVELALALRASVRGSHLDEGLDRGNLENEIRLCLELAASAGQIIVFTNVQYWLDEDSTARGPLQFVLGVANASPVFTSRPLFVTSTRRPNIESELATSVALIHVPGLADEHIETLLKISYYSIYGDELSASDAKTIAPLLHGHPVAARMAAGLLREKSADFLANYPADIIGLRRDLARILLRDLTLSVQSKRLMEMLSLADIGLPPSVLAANGMTDEEFQQAVSQCASAGLIVAGKTISSHPLVREFFWHDLHRGEYTDLAIGLADAMSEALRRVNKDSVDYVNMLRAAYRCYALCGEYSKAAALRQDLSGELAATAITLYNRRKFDLADQYIEQVLEGDPSNWRMRLYRARIRIAQENWAQADGLLAELLAERPGDISVLHAMGRRLMRSGNREGALEIFLKVIVRRNHVASLRDAAECLHRLKRDEEALSFLERAKEQESENPYVLDLESQILEGLGELERAYSSGLLASARDPGNAHMHNRLGIIRSKQKLPLQALQHFKQAIVLDPEWFSPGNSLIAVHLDHHDIESAEEAVANLESKVKTATERALLEHTKARVALAKLDYETCEKILQRELSANRNVIPNLGLKVQVKCALFDQVRSTLPAVASLRLKEAEEALDKIRLADPENEFLDRLTASVSERRLRV